MGRSCGCVNETKIVWTGPDWRIVEGMSCQCGGKEGRGGSVRDAGFMGEEGARGGCARRWAEVGLGVCQTGGHHPTAPAPHINPGFIQTRRWAESNARVESPFYTPKSFLLDQQYPPRLVSPSPRSASLLPPSLHHLHAAHIRLRQLLFFGLYLLDQHCLVFGRANTIFSTSNTPRSAALRRPLPPQSTLPRLRTRESYFFTQARPGLSVSSKQWRIPTNGPPRSSRLQTPLGASRRCMPM